MPEVGQTILNVDQVGFQRLPDVQALDNLGVPVLGKQTHHYAILLEDSVNNRIWVVPIEDNVRKLLIENMRRAPLEVNGLAT
jgi:hypothetical protein